jgi:hypothetical protein
MGYTPKDASSVARHWKCASRSSTVGPSLNGKDAASSGGEGERARSKASTEAGEAETKEVEWGEPTKIESAEASAR